ncbi:hypothetical protein CWI38_1470p0010 [Hamiltosporidium tvaerminnensis]|uniref:Protein kinase domain-containing protein n=1 Tax=Hamiltosporidium tvaerminnensis TaxID=1176355 RepID=A0A4Q9LR10_9MICR|nr:hypothetical protein LUQ84_000273 [Hamiltosporidium tvaerminnensis]TBU10928.1 hypothetical protein CWI38_1470p0010 [Hamiltosporidium tvaerminnensis]
MIIFLLSFIEFISLSPEYNPMSVFETDFPKTLEITRGNEVKVYIITDNYESYGRSFYRRLGYDKHTNEAVIISKESYIEDSESKTVKTVKNLDHENIEKLYYSTKINGVEYCVFEYIPETLESYCIKNEIKLDGFIFFVKQILDAIYYLYSNRIAYKFFSMHHIRITSDLKIKLVDVLASEFNTSGCSHDFSNDCNVSEYYEIYCAPEYYLKNPCKCKVSIWCLGILLRENIIYIPKIDDLEKHVRLYNCWYDFESILLNFSPIDRPWPLRALLHPIFDNLFNFLFCFESIENFIYNIEGVFITKNDKTINYKKENINFSIFCCCVDQKLVKSCIIVSPPDEHYDFCDLCQRFPTSRKIKFKIEINEKIIPVQLVSYNIYYELKNLFKILLTEFKHIKRVNCNPKVLVSKIPRLLSSNSN